MGKTLKAKCDKGVTLKPGISFELQLRKEDAYQVAVVIIGLQDGTFVLWQELETLLDLSKIITLAEGEGLDQAKIEEARQLMLDEGELQIDWDATDDYEDDAAIFFSFREEIIPVPIRDWDLPKLVELA